MAKDPATPATSSVAEVSEETAEAGVSTCGAVVDVALQPLSHAADEPDEKQRRRLSEQLLTACSRGILDLVRPLITRRAYVQHTRGPDGWTALIAASATGRHDIATILLESNADVTTCAKDGFTALMEACAGGHADTTKLLLRYGAPLTQLSPDGTSALILASIRGHAECVGALLVNRADLAQSKRDGFTALRAAAGNGHTAALRLLLHAGALSPELNPNSEGSDEGAAALLSACAGGHVGTATLLLDHGIAATIAASDGTTALLQACMANHRDVAALLIEHAADLNFALEAARRRNLPGARRVLLNLPDRRNYATQASSECASTTKDAAGSVNSTVGVKVRRSGRRRAETVNNRIATGASQTNDAAMPTAAGGRAVSTSAKAEINITAPVDASLEVTDAHGNIDNVPSRDTIAPSPPVPTCEDTFDGAAPSVNQTNAADLAFASCESSVATLAAQASGFCEQETSFNDEIIQPQVGSSISDTNLKAGDRLSTQLLTACSKGLTPLVEMLIARGASLNHKRDTDGWTPLMACSSCGHLEAVSILLTKGARVDATASDGFTALLESCVNGHLGVSEALLRHRAGVDQAARDGTTPLVGACVHGHAQLARLLLINGADVRHRTNRGGNTALRAACGNGHVAVAQLLLHHPGQDNLLETDGAAALLSACANGHVHVAQLLLDRGVPANAAPHGDDTTALMKACMAGQREVAALLIAHGADIEGARDAARRQNSLSGVERVLRQAQPRAKANLAVLHGSTSTPIATAAQNVEQEAVDLDVLVREIEGPCAAADIHRAQSSASFPNRGKQKLQNKTFCDFAPPNQKPSTSSRLPSPSSSSSASARWLEQFAGRGHRQHANTIPLNQQSISCTPGSLVNAARADTFPCPKAAAASALECRPGAASVEHIATTQVPVNVDEDDAPGGLAALAPGNASTFAAAAFAAWGAAWPMQQMPPCTLSSGHCLNSNFQRWRRSPGTYYTVEVLTAEIGPQLKESPRDAVGSKPITGAHSVTPGSKDRSYDVSSGSGVQRNGGVRDWPWNAAVMAARCRGSPAAELSLIPYSTSELTELAHLAEGGIAFYSQNQPADSSGAVSPVSTPSSLPDRDAPEDFAAWCVEVQRRCQAAARGRCK